MRDMDSVILSDMAMCQPTSALSTDPGRGQWGVYDYETDAVRGRAVYARPGAGAPPLKLPLEAEGWHRVFLGIHYGHTYSSHAAKLGCQHPDQFLWVRLSSDPVYALVEPEFPGKRGPATGDRRFGFADVAEVLWRCADLTGQHLHLAPRRSARFPATAAGIAWVRLEAMTPAEMKGLRERREDATRKRLVYVADTDLHDDYPVAEDEVRRQLEPLRDSDFSLVLWTTSMGDVCYYPSKRFPRALVLEGELSPYGYAPAGAPGPGDTLQAAADTAHELGLRIHATMRPAASRMPPLHWPRARGDLFHTDPSTWQSGRHGEPVGHYSIASPAVRERLVAVLTEQARYWPIDGVHLLLNRGWPFVGYEEPVVQSFVRQQGEDPRQLDPMDRRWWLHKAGYMSSFVAELRRSLDEAGEARGVRLGLSMTVMAGVEQCLSLGLDIRYWLEQRWLNHLIVHPCWLPTRWLDTDVPGHASVTAERVREVAALAKGTGCKVYADVYPRYLPAEQYPRRAREYYEAEADGLCFWDTYSRIPRRSEWQAIRRLGRVEDVGELEREARGFLNVFPLRSAAGMSLRPEHTPATNG